MLISSAPARMRAIASCTEARGLTTPGFHWCSLVLHTSAAAPTKRAQSAGGPAARSAGHRARRNASRLLRSHRSALPTLDRLRNEGGWFSRARVNFLPTVTALRKKAGRNGFIVVITADHGMPPEPAGPRKRYFDLDVVKLLHQKFDPDRGALVQHYEAWNSELFIDPDRLPELRLTTSDIKAYLEAQPSTPHLRRMK